tara:strand:+ start:730 stop:1059 length:330 start_codon:yes stop_codon:yes gene_type:complete
MAYVVDDESEDSESTPDHHPGGAACFCGGWTAVFLAYRPIADGQLDRQPDMNYKDGEQADASDPYGPSVAQLVEPKCIFVDSVLARKEEKVSDEMPGEKEEKGNTRDRD